MNRVAYCLMSIGLLTSCSSMNYVGIETYNPAEITFPTTVEKVLIVNNALPQPEDVGCEYILFGEKIDTCRANADSTMYYAANGLGKAIAEMPYFHDVLLYHDATRKDTDYFEDKRLTHEQVKALCEGTGTDAIISIDRLLFESKKEVVEHLEGYLSGEILVKMSSVLRGYLPSKENPLATIHIVDSVMFYEEAPNWTVLNQLLPPSNTALNVAAEYLTTQASPNFVPHWKNETRWYYTNSGARWKEATAYVRQGKWENAFEIWKALFDNIGSWSAQAKAASNIALSYEMKTDLEQAHEWASKSLELFKKGEGNEGENTQLLMLYEETLRNRIHSDKKLNMQFGE